MSGAGRGSKPAAVIGAGPNGLAAAVTLARAGVPVTVFEAAETIGGGTRTTELVQPGVLHDVCSAIHPLALVSPFFREFELAKRVEFAVPEASYAHPFDGAVGGLRHAASNHDSAAGRGVGRGSGRAAIAYRDLQRTADELGRDGAAYARFYRPLLHRLEGVVEFALGPTTLRLQSDPLAAVMLGWRTVEQGSPAQNLRFRDEAAAALLSGVIAHGIGRMPSLATAGIGTLLGALGHSSGWPVPVGGSRAISDALAADLIAHGGEVRTEHPVDDIRELSGFDVQLFDTSARGLVAIAGSVLPRRYRRALSRFGYGEGASKVDFVLDGPIPWRDSRVSSAPTVHIGGSRSEILAAELEVTRGRHPERPFVLLAQPAEFDPARNPAGSNAVWSYTHVPRGSSFDMSERVIAQIERFAPGFRDRIVAVRLTTAAELSQQNRNYHGGDFGSGAMTLRQILMRPTLSRDPHRTPTPGLYFASSSVSPGPGVHGLAGWYAARSALRHDYGLPAPNLGI